MSNRSQINWALVGAAVVITVDSFTKGELPTPRRYLGLTALWIGLTFLASPVPGLAVPLAYLVLAAVTFERGPELWEKVAGTIEAPGSPSGTKELEILKPQSSGSGGGKVEGVDPRGGKKGPKPGTAPTAQAGAKAKANAAWQAIQREVPGATFLGIVRDPEHGLNNCSNPSVNGPCGYSQHNYGNALDIGGSQEVLRRVGQWAQRNKHRFGISNILGPWNEPDNHSTHVHLDFLPKYCGVPPGHKC